MFYIKNKIIIFLILIIKFILCFDNFDIEKLTFSDQKQGYFYNLNEISNRPFSIGFNYSLDGFINTKGWTKLELSWSLGFNSYCLDKMDPNHQYNASFKAMSLNPSVCLVNNDDFAQIIIAKQSDLTFSKYRYGNGLVAKFSNDRVSYNCKGLDNKDVDIELLCDYRVPDIQPIGCKFSNSNITCPGLLCRYKTKHACPKIIYREIESNSYYDDNGILYTDRYYNIINYESYRVEKFNVSIDFHLKNDSIGIIGMDTIAPGLYNLNNTINFLNFTMIETLYSKYKSPYPYYSFKNLNKKSVKDDPSPPPYEVFWYMQTLDHFNFQTVGQFAQRYLISDTFWNKPTPNSNICNGPVIFYTGNEGDITWFYENSQFITNVLAKEMGALLFFAEHRYYGETLPFGNDSLSQENLGYLTSEQALADYAELIPSVLKDLGAEHCPVISVGGSYGGMLTAWFRMKYPNIVDAGLAASAPILMFYGTGASQESFNKIATDDFTQTSSEGTCSSRIRNSFNLINQISQQTNGLQQLTNTFSLCDPLTQVSDLINWIESGLTYMAMADYPYPNEFLEPMPGNPINVSCEALATTTDDIQGLLKVLNVYYNYTGTTQCYNTSVFTTSALGSNAWDYQACTEMVMPISSNGVQDMFPASPFNLQQLTAQCQQDWGVTPNPNWITTYYGGSNFTTSNLIFSNGRLDPWSGGGVEIGKSDSVIALVIEGGAHHLDLRMPNQADPDSVIEARITETKLLTMWAQEAALKKQRK